MQAVSIYPALTIVCRHSDWKLTRLRSDLIYLDPCRSDPKSAFDAQSSRTPIRSNPRCPSPCTLNCPFQDQNLHRSASFVLVSSDSRSFSSISLICDRAWLIYKIRPSSSPSPPKFCADCCDPSCTSTQLGLTISRTILDLWLIHLSLSEPVQDFSLSCRPNPVQSVGLVHYVIDFTWFTCLIPLFLHLL